jgi:hypothetical protein
MGFRSLFFWMLTFASAFCSGEAFAHKTSSVLPKGIFRARLVNVIGEPVVATFDEGGSRKELLAPLEQKVGAATLAAGNASLKTLYDSLNSFEPDLGNELYSAQLLADSKINFHQVTAALEYGLSESVSLGIIVPFTRVSGQASFGADITSNAAKIKKMVKGTLLEQGVEQFEAQIPGAAVLSQEIFTSKGYNVPGDFEYAGLGDIEIGAKIQPWKNSRLQTSIQTGFRLPTSTHKKDYANLLDQSTGDEQLDFAFEAGMEARITRDLSTGIHSRYTWQLPRSAEVAMLKSGQSGLPDLNDPTTFAVVDKNLGDYSESEVFMAYTINNAWTPYTAYTYSFKGSDGFKGPAGYNYQALESDTSYQAHTLMVGFNYSTVKGYVAKKAPIPLEIDFSFNKILKAQNKTDSAYGRLDLIVFF